MPIQHCTVDGCLNKGRYCRLHRVETFKPAAGIDREADSKKATNAEYRKEAKKFITLNPKCKVCGKPAESIHHQKGRVEDLLLDKRFWMALCLPCHQYFETHPKEARKRGVSVSRLNPGHEPANH